MAAHAASSWEHPSIRVTVVLTTQKKDAERLRDFLVQHTPHKIFVGASCMHCGQLYEDLQKVLLLTQFVNAPCSSSLHVWDMHLFHASANQSV